MMEKQTLYHGSNVVVEQWSSIQMGLSAVNKIWEDFYWIVFTFFLTLQKIKN